MSLRRFSFLFATIVILDLILGQNAVEWRYVSKPLITISLLWYSWFHLKKNIQVIDRLFLAALIAAWFGDVFLLWDDLFVWGLSSFLIMQLLYILTFVKSQNYYGLREWVYAASLSVFLYLTLTWLWPQLGDMAIPVLVYSGAICTMSWFAWTRDKRSSGYWAIWIGTLFFILSDMTIAIHKFTDVHLGDLTIMSTYCIAQFLIVFGYLSYRRGRLS
ncbi:MAG: putative membrane protein YhhN [Saprospiraceae bacterium]|jgi:uncharacterized membrane protein YhhN